MTILFFLLPAMVSYRASSATVIYGLNPTSFSPRCFAGSTGLQHPCVSEREGERRTEREKERERERKALHLWVCIMLVWIWCVSVHALGMCVCVCVCVLVTVLSCFFSGSAVMESTWEQFWKMPHQSVPILLLFSNSSFGRGHWKVPLVEQFENSGLCMLLPLSRLPIPLPVPLPPITWQVIEPFLEPHL
jgi:hypothetical protein